MDAHEARAVREQLDLALDDLLLGALAVVVDRAVLGARSSVALARSLGPRLVLACGLDCSLGSPPGVGRRVPGLVLRRALDSRPRRRGPPTGRAPRAGLAGAARWDAPRRGPSSSARRLLGGRAALLAMIASIRSSLRRRR